MSDTNNVISVKISAPDAAGEIAVGRPCNLRGFWCTPDTGVTNLLFYNNATSAAGDILLDIDVLNSPADFQPSIGQTLPGNGIRFDTGIFVTGRDTNTILSITLFYQ